MCLLDMAAAGKGHAGGVVVSVVKERRKGASGSVSPDPTMVHIRTPVSSLCSCSRSRRVSVSPPRPFYSPLSPARPCFQCFWLGRYTVARHNALAPRRPVTPCHLSCGCCISICERYEWFTFATRARMSPWAAAPRSRAPLHISAKQSQHTVGGTACWDCLPRACSRGPPR